MSYKNPNKKTEYMKEYNPKYYKENRERILEYRKGRRTQDKLNWQKWWNKKLDTIRKEKIKSGEVYKRKKMFN